MQTTNQEEDNLASIDKFFGFNSAPSLNRADGEVLTDEIVQTKNDDVNDITSINEFFGFN